MVLRSGKYFKCENTNEVDLAKSYLKIKLAKFEITREYSTETKDFSCAALKIEMHVKFHMHN